MRLSLQKLLVVLEQERVLLSEVPGSRLVVPLVLPAGQSIRRTAAQVGVRTAAQVGVRTEADGCGGCGDSGTSARVAIDSARSLKREGKRADMAAGEGLSLGAQHDTRVASARGAVPRFISAVVTNSATPSLGGQRSVRTKKTSGPPGRHFQAVGPG